MKARRKSFLLAPLTAVALVSSCASIAAPPQAGAPGGATRPRWTGGGEAQVYPAGVVAAVYAERTLSERDSLLLRGGYNATERGDFGKHDDESGGGPGFGLAYRHAFAPGRADGWFAGARIDLWFLEVDWRDDPSPAAPGGRSGSSDVIVVQPAAEGGYGWWHDPGRLDLTLTLGAEINVDTQGEDVGEGAILLAGIRYSL